MPFRHSVRRREGELVALAFNQKEQRLLERAVTTIRMEASYSLKLLELHNRSARAQFRQLKDKVSKLRSHLAPEEIQALRQLEEEGKLQPMYPQAGGLNSAYKIAAGARALHSAQPGPRRPELASLEPPPPSPSTPATGPGSPRVLRKRSNSVTGVFIDAPCSDGSGVTRPVSADVRRRRSEEGQLGLSHRAGRKEGTVVAPVVDRPLLPAEAPQSPTEGAPSSADAVTPSAAISGPTLPGNSGSSGKENSGEAPQRTSRAKEPSEAGGLAERSPAINEAPSEASTHPREASTAPRACKASCNNSSTPEASTPSHNRTSFSSHAASERGEVGDDQRGAVSGRRPSLPQPLRSQHLTLDKTSSFLGLLQDDGLRELNQELYDERRADLLEGERHRAEVITRRKEQFLKDMDQYIHDHPAPTSSVPRTRRVTMSRKISSRQREGEERAEDNGVPLMERQRRVDFDLSPTYLPEAEYRERLLGLWKNMNTCRYLRLPDHSLDLSGVNTLATDTLKMYKVLQHR